MKIDAVIPRAVRGVYGLMGLGIQNSLKKIGFDSDLVIYDGQELNCDYAIFYAAQMYQKKINKGNAKLIMWQTENLPLSKKKTSEYSERKRREFDLIRPNFDFVWAEKVGDKAYLETKEFKFDALVYPGYFSELVIAPLDNRGYDVVFFGANNKRRGGILRTFFEMDKC